MSRWKGLAGWLPLLALAALSLAGYRYWTDRLKDSPVAPVHAAFLDHLAAQSEQARRYRQAYADRFGRDSVASRHFEQVCAAMVAAAQRDGVDPAAYSEPMARSCRSVGRKFASGALPD